MGERKRILTFVLIMAAVAALAIGATLALLHSTSFERHRVRLSEVACNTARIVEMAARYHEAVRPNASGEDAAAIALSALRGGASRSLGLGESGEIRLARQSDGTILALWPKLSPDTITRSGPPGLSLSEPMRLALKGRSGTLVGLDGRGVRVLAAHEPVAGLGWSVIAQIDLSEIRAPFVKAGLYLLVLTLVMIAICTKFLMLFADSLVRRLRASEVRTQAIVEIADDGIVIADAGGVILSWNSAAERIFGYSAAETVGHSLVDLIVPERYRETKGAAMRRFARDGQGRALGTTLELTALHKSGAEFPIELTLSAFRDASGFMALAMVRDITQRKLTELREREQAAQLAAKNEALEAQRQQLRAQHDELLAVNAALVQARNTAEAASRAKSEFLANMSHEIRTPMTAILGFAENLLLPDLPPQEARSAAETIRRNGEHLLAIINDILDLSKIEAGKLEIERIACSPRQILSEVATLFRGAAEAKQLNLKIESLGPIPDKIRCDPTRLRQILQNMVGNAVKFTASGSVGVLVSEGETAAGARFLQFDVIDTGVGMTEEQSRRLFEPFMQADSSTTRQFGGTGLGLTLTRHLAELLGGTAELVRSAPGQGSHFRFTVAAVTADEETAAAGTVTWPEGCLTEPLPADSPRIEARVLLAEDGPDNQRLISFMLHRMGVEVTVANDGRKAVNEVLASMEMGQPYDAVLMDVQMPTCDGYEATRLLRAAGYEKPIIALTAQAMAGDRQKCIAAGCDDYISKPIHRVRLSEVLQHLLNDQVSRAGRADDR
ncbi:MAG: response regulator [Phycisphaerae bacterium]|nr:response regulator [Phycisphaerae bacterium]